MRSEHRKQEHTRTHPQAHFFKLRPHSCFQIQTRLSSTPPPPALNSGRLLQLLLLCTSQGTLTRGPHPFPCHPSLAGAHNSTYSLNSHGLLIYRCLHSGVSKLTLGMPQTEILLSIPTPSDSFPQNGSPLNRCPRGARGKHLNALNSSP